MKTSFRPNLVYIDDDAVKEIVDDAQKNISIAKENEEVKQATDYTVYDKFSLTGLLTKEAPPLRTSQHGRHRT